MRTQHNKELNKKGSVDTTQQRAEQKGSVDTTQQRVEQKRQCGHTTQQRVEQKRNVDTTQQISKLPGSHAPSRIDPRKDADPELGRPFQHPGGVRLDLPLARTGSQKRYRIRQFPVGYPFFFFFFFKKKKKKKKNDEININLQKKKRAQQNT
jgi:hypothetical protein